MMASLVDGAAIGLGIYVWLRHWPAWVLAIGFGAGMIMSNVWVMMAGLLIGLGFSLYLEAGQWEARRDAEEQAALLFLVRLRQLLGVRGTLAAALDDMGYRSGWGGGDAGERVLGDIARQFQVGALTFLARVALLIRRHGGSLIPVADWASDTIQGAHVLRQARRLEEAAQRSTILILALAPWGIMVLFRIIVPSFYRALGTTRIGDGVVMVIGGVTLAVLLLLSHHMRQEAVAR